MAYALRTIDKWELIKLQRFCKAKYTVNRTKWQPTDWEKVFTNPTTSRGHSSNVYKELMKLDSRVSNNPIKNGVRAKQGVFNWGNSNGSEAPTEMFIILSYQGNTNQNNPEIPPHNGQNSLDQKLRGQKMLERMWRKRNISPLLVGLQAGKTTVGIRFVVPQKIGHSATWGLNYTTPGHIPREFSNM